MKYLTSALVAGLLIASPAAAQKIGVASDSEVIAPVVEDGGLLGGSLTGAGIAGLVAVAAIVAVAASSGNSSSSTDTSGSTTGTAAQN